MEKKWEVFYGGEWHPTSSDSAAIHTVLNSWMFGSPWPVRLV